MTQHEAETLFDRLCEAGFSGGINCSCYCIDGHFEMRSRLAGQPKSPHWAVSCTPCIAENQAQSLKEILEDGKLTGARFSRGTYVITGWTPR